MEKTNQMKIGIHQIPKSPWKFLLLVFQHVFAMFGANILVPILVNAHAGTEVIPLQVAFFCSGVGTILYLIITGFNTPIYLGSSFAYLGGMTTLYAATIHQGDKYVFDHLTGGYNIFFSLMIVGLVYVILAMVIYFTKSAKSIKKLIPPVVVGPAIILIGWGLIGNAAKDAYLNVSALAVDSNNIGLIWTMIAISAITFTTVVIAMVFLKGIWKMIPILMGLLVGIATALIIWGICKGVGNTQIANGIFDPGSEAVEKLLDPSKWVWYPDITLMWKANVANHTPFRIEVYLALVPLAVVTISEHIGDHVNLGHLTGNDFIAGKPGLHRTLLGDGIATMVSAAFGGPANTSYGENTSVISITKVASVWVIFGAACTSILISFIAPISLLLNVMPKPVLGGVEIILYSMIGINGLRIMIKEQIDMFDPKNIIIVAILVVCGLGGTTLIFLPKDVMGSEIALGGTGVGVIVAIILNAVIPSKRDDKEDTEVIPSIDFTPSDFMRIGTNKKDRDTYQNVYVDEQKIVKNVFKGKVNKQQLEMLLLIYDHPHITFNEIKAQMSHAKEKDLYHLLTINVINETKGRYDLNVHWKQIINETKQAQYYH